MILLKDIELTGRPFGNAVSGCLAGFRRVLAVVLKASADWRNKTQWIRLRGRWMSDSR